MVPITLGAFSAVFIWRNCIINPFFKAFEISVYFPGVCAAVKRFAWFLGNQIPEMVFDQSVHGMCSSYSNSLLMALWCIVCDNIIVNYCQINYKMILIDSKRSYNYWFWKTDSLKSWHFLQSDLLNSISKYLNNIFLVIQW